TDMSRSCELRGADKIRGDLKFDSVRNCGACLPDRAVSKDPMVGQFLSAVAFLVLLVLHTPSAAQERPKVFLGASSKTLVYSPLWVGAKRGFFEQQGLDVQLVLLRG